MSKIIEQAHEIWEAKGSKMTIVDWQVIGEALTEGKEWCDAHKGYGGDKGFGKWCRENGFSDIASPTRSNAQWSITTPAKEFTLSLTQSKKEIPRHVDTLRAMYRAAQKKQLGKPVKHAVLDHIYPKKPQSPQQVADAMDIPLEDIRRRFPDLKREGFIHETAKGWIKVATRDIPAAKKEAAKDIPRTSMVRMNSASYELVSYLANAADKEDVEKQLAAINNLDLRPASNMREINTAPAFIEIIHSRNLGDPNVKATSDGVNGKLKITVRVEVVDE